MEAQTAQQRPNDSSVIFVTPNDTRRLLEVYVKRSLSLNDESLRHKRHERKLKWVTIPKSHRRHSSDPSIHLAGALNDGTFHSLAPTETPPDIPPDNNVSKKSKKNKKPSLWKTFLGLFSRRSTEEKDEVQECSSNIPEASDDDADRTAVCLPASTPTSSTKKSSSKRMSLKRRFSKRRLSHTKIKREACDPEDIAGVEAVVSVEPTISYYEKMSEELEKILHEVKENEDVVTMSDEEVINRIIALTKEQGDAIDDKIKDNSTLRNFFQGLSYSSFQRLADAYLLKEASPTRMQPIIPSTAPELVKLAFTLDFTARVASLSRQNVGYITGLGNRYLQDRFEYKQACSEHP
ncbi:apoptosis facilitator Bcl-2-like protein 14 [Syngnathus scovelli]|uniref:apoptosis facilitator Bcl-2-like protein 14 n=1 Tax=Syngnathus scovelli TaxID=161590 RepID=UPI00210FB5B8|nr:uncharacterized protein LOC125977636 [Syngnathus scovelli]XP_049590378.1 uncharacterized protein LOC125977636 [Syngnathus scovelli]